jgi:hypothetical protein
MTSMQTLFYLDLKDDKLGHPAHGDPRCRGLRSRTEPADEDAACALGIIMRELLRDCLT